MKLKSLICQKDKIERAIKRGTGEIEGKRLEEITYEAFGPRGIAVIIECITDNRNRTLGEIKNILQKYNGKLAESGSVKWLFERKGIITLQINNEETSPNKDKSSIELIAIESGAEDIDYDEKENILDIYTETEELERVKENLINKKLEIALLDNIQRKDLNAMEKARAYQRLIDEFNLTQENISKRLGVARATVANTLRLLRLPEVIQNAIEQEKISEGHAKTLCSINDPNKQEILLKRILGMGLTVRETAKMVDTRRTKRRKKLIPELEKIFLISIRAFNNTAIVVCTKEKSEEGKKIPHLDIFFWHKDGNTLRRKAYVGLDSPTGTDTNKGRDFPIEWVSQFASLPIGDKMLSVPKNPVFFCEFRYGKSWITPMTIPNWNRLDSKENLTIKPE